MKVWFSAALGAAALMVVGTSVTTPASAADTTAGVQQHAGKANASAVDEFSSRRRYRRYYGGPRYYYGGPRYYRPYGYYGSPYYRPYGYGYGPGYYGRPGITFGFGF